MGFSFVPQTGGRDKYIYFLFHNHILFIFSSVAGHLGFHLLAVMNNVAMNTGICVSPCFQFSWVYTQGWNCGSYGNSVLNFEEQPCYFHSRCIILQSHQQYKRVLISPHSCQHFFFYNSRPNGCEVVSHCCYFSVLVDNKQYFSSLL